MKKLYIEPDIEIVGFCLTSDVLYSSTVGTEETIKPEDGGYMPDDDIFG